MHVRFLHICSSKICTRTPSHGYGHPWGGRLQDFFPGISKLGGLWLPTPACPRTQARWGLNVLEKCINNSSTEHFTVTTIAAVQNALQGNLPPRPCLQAHVSASQKTNFILLKLCSFLSFHFHLLLLVRIVKYS